MSSGEKGECKGGKVAQVNCHLYSIAYNLDQNIDAEKQGKGILNRYTGGQSAGFLQYFCKDKSGRNIKTGKNPGDINLEDIVSTPAYQTLKRECTERGLFIDIAEQPIRKKNNLEEKDQFSLLIKVHGWNKRT